MTRQAIKDLRSRQQVKDEQINYLLVDVEKNLEEYKIALKTKEKQLSDAKKILVSAKQSYVKTVAENRPKSIYRKIKTTYSTAAGSIFRKTKKLLSTYSKKVQKSSVS